MTQPSYRGFPASPPGMTVARLARIRKLGVTCVALTFLLMTIGAWVKANDAGLACPDWPQCYGKWFPPFPSAENGGTWDVDGDGDLDRIGYSQAQELYEWAHRAVQPLIIIPVALLFLATRVGTGAQGFGARTLAFLRSPLQAWRPHPALHPGLPRLAGWAILVYLAQAGLGAVTVLTGNQPWATTMHLAMAVVWLAIFIVATCIAYLAPKGALRAPPVAPASPHPAFAPGRDVGFAYEDSHGR